MSSIKTVSKHIPHHSGLNLLSDPIPKLIRQLAIPVSIGFFFQTMYNVVDTLFAGLISTDALAAMTLFFPLFIIILALGNGVGIGSSALIANALGAKDKSLAKKYALQSLSYGIIVSVIVTILGLFFAPSLFIVMGATPAVLILAKQYSTVLFIGAIFFILTHIFNSILMATGDTKSFRNILVGGFFLNILLDPLFLFGWLGVPKLGLTGIALATIIIQFIGTVYLSYRVSKSGLLSFKVFKTHWKPNKKLFAAISKQGLLASFNHLAMAIGMFILTYFAGRFSIVAVAAIGISMRVEQIAVLPSIGLNIAALTLVGQNNGAKNFTRIKEIIKFSIKYGVILTILFSAIIFIFAKPILGLFSTDVEVLRIGLIATRIATLYLAAYVIFGISVSSLQAMKKPFFAMWGAIGRQFIGPLLLFPLFAYTFNLGISGLFWATFTIAWILAGISLIYLKVVFNKLK